MNEFGDLELIGKTDRIHKPHSIVYVWKCRCGEITEKTRAAARNSLRCYKCNYKNKLYKGYEDISGTYWNGIIKSAKERNIEFSISKEYIWELFIEQNKRCALTGIELNIARNYRQHPEEQTASLDRKDNEKGYIEGNLWWVHKQVNKLKHILTVEELLKWSKLLYEFNNNQSREINPSVSSI